MVYYLSLDFTYFFSSCQLTVDSSKLSIPEMAIQQIWAEQGFSKKNLRTVSGQSVKIEFAGWYNSVSGPHFKEVCLQIEKH